MFDEAAKIRVGEVGSPVNIGDFSPNFKRYVRGQFAPSIDKLASEKLSEAKDSGVVDESDPNFSGFNLSDPESLNGWDYQKLFDQFGRGITVDRSTPIYSIVSLYFACKVVPNSFLSDVNLRNIDFQQEGLETDPITGARVLTQNKVFRSSLVVFPKFYRFISAPIVRQIPGRKFGLSVANYSALHSFGHILYKKLAFQAKFAEISAVTKLNGWNKNTIHGVSGSFLTFKNGGAWRRDPKTEYLSEVSKFSPDDTFSEMFAQYYTNRAFLKLKNEKAFEAIDDILKYYK